MICLMHSVQIMRGEVSVKALLGVRRININICYAWRLWAGYRGQIRKPASFLTLQFQAILLSLIITELKTLDRGTCLQGAFLALPSSCCCSLVSTKINILPLAKGKRPFSLHYGALQLQTWVLCFYSCLSPSIRLFDKVRYNSRSLERRLCVSLKFLKQLKWRIFDKIGHGRKEIFKWKHDDEFN